MAAREFVELSEGVRVPLATQFQKVALRAAF